MDLSKDQIVIMKGFRVIKLSLCAIYWPSTTNTWHNSAEHLNSYSGM